MNLLTIVLYTAGILALLSILLHRLIRNIEQRRITERAALKAAARV